MATAQADLGRIAIRQTAHGEWYVEVAWHNDADLPPAPRVLSGRTFLSREAALHALREELRDIYSARAKLAAEVAEDLAAMDAAEFEPLLDCPRYQPYLA